MLKKVLVIVIALFVLLSFSLPNGIQSAKYIISGIHSDERTQEVIKLVFYVAQIVFLIYVMIRQMTKKVQ